MSRQRGTSALRGLTGLALLVLTASEAAAQEPPPSADPGEAYAPELDVGIWFDEGEEPVLDRGDRVRVYYSVAEDAYVAVFAIDTDGNVRLVHPRSPEQSRVRGGRTYRALFPRTPYWLVDDAPGMGYFFVLASLEPLDFTSIPHRYGSGWDLTFVGRHVYADPFDAMDDYVAALIPNWEGAPYGLAMAAYHVESRHDFPRFMCYDCHAFQPYRSWNPYRSYCSSFRVVIWEDYYAYPVRRYGANRVAYPRRQAAPRFEFKEAVAVGGGGPPIRRRAEPREGPAGVERPARRRGTGGTGVLSPSRGGDPSKETGAEATRGERSRPTVTVSGARGPSSSLFRRGDARSRTVRPREVTGSDARPRAAVGPRATPRTVRPRTEAGAADRDRARVSPRPPPTPDRRIRPPSRPNVRPKSPSRPNVRPTSPSRPTVRAKPPSRVRPKPKRKGGSG